MWLLNMTKNNKRVRVVYEEEVSYSFPVGMRVLAVDHDPTCLTVLENLLQKCHYQVTTTNQANEALRMLREKRNNFDLVISDLNMPDIDGFKFLQVVWLEIGLPVIMLSAHSDTKLVMKGVAHGACDYLLKPVRIEDLKKIWQHVVRRKKYDGEDKPSKEEKAPNIAGEGSQGIISESSSEQNKKLGKIRKDQSDDEEEMEDPSAQKRPRLAWSMELHEKFVAAVNQLGPEEAVPRKILELMNVEGITKYNVASHLQKYRLSLKKATQQAKMVAFVGGYDSNRLNSPAGLNMKRISPSSLTSPAQPQNTNKVGNIRLSALPANQSSSLLHVIPTSINIAPSQHRNCTTGIASALPESRVTENNANNSLPCVTSNHSMLHGNSQQTHSGAFRNQYSVRAAPLRTDSFDVGMCGNSQSATQLSNFSASSFPLCKTFNNDQLPPAAIHVFNSITIIGDSPVNFSSRIARSAHLEDSRSELQCEQGLEGNILQPPRCTHRQRWEQHRLDYNQNMTRPFDAVNSHAFSSGVMSSLGYGLSLSNAICSNRIDASLNGASPSMSRCNEDEKLSGAFILEQMKSEDGFIQNSLGTLDEITGSMVKREQHDLALMDGELGFDAYPLGFVFFCYQIFSLISFGKKNLFLIYLLPLNACR